MIWLLIILAAVFAIGVLVGVFVFWTASMYLPDGTDDAPFGPGGPL